LNGEIKYSVALTHREWQGHESAIELLSIPVGATEHSERLHLAGKLSPVTISPNIASNLASVNLYYLVGDGEQTVGWAVLDISRSLPLTCKALLVSTRSSLKTWTPSLNSWNVLLLDGKTAGLGLSYVRIGVGLVDPLLGIFADTPVHEVQII
jgi:hypothetical protein